jgi:hypothetical protein
LVKELPNDIEPIVEVETLSLYLSFGLLLLTLLTLILAIRYIPKLFGKRDRSRENSLKELHQIDWKSNPKETAYKITKHGRIVARSEREERVLRELEELLEKYKYRKSVDNFSDEVIGKFHIFMEVVESE